MRVTMLAVAAVVLAASPVIAETTKPVVAKTTKPVHKAAHKSSSDYRPSDGKPIDVGPDTPEANRAYQGGGVILQGAPGAPAPTPQPTPPGQMPRNAVPN